jgi:hypothetical protein
MQQRILIHLSVAVLAGFAMPASAKPSYTTFDPPNSQYTYPMSLQSGVVAGSYQDYQGYMHGFVRATDGTITTFDPTDSNGTYIITMNPDDTIVGYADDLNYLGHGFLRTADGTITAIEPKHAVTTYPYGITKKGEIAGYYRDTSNNWRGFFRKLNGSSNISTSPIRPSWPSGH